MDLEMTGLDPTRHVIVEVASLVTDDQLAVVEEGPDLEPRRDINVTADRAAVRARRVAQAMVAEEAGARTLDFIRAHVPQPGTAPLCGNSIGTDRKFLAAYLPAVENHLHYRSIDVSTVKELCRRWYPDAFAAAPEKASGHRALEDIRESVAELAYYRSAIFRPGPAHQSS